MKRPYRSLLNLCAFGLLLVALYLNFVDLKRHEDVAATQPAHPTNKALTAVASAPHGIALRR